MPMKRLSTQCMDDLRNRTKKNPKEKSGPRKQTLDFLSQFARVYQAEPVNQPELCAYVLN